MIGVVSDGAREPEADSSSSLWRVPSRQELRLLATGTGLLGRFGYLVLTQVVVVVLGMGYWAFTTRYVAAGSVGISAAAMSTAVFLSAVGILGIGSLLLVELTRIDADEQPSVLIAGVGVAMISALVLGLLVWGLSPVLGHNLGQLGRSPADALLFVAGTVLTSVVSVLDAAAIGLHRSRVQFVRNALAAALRVGAIAVLVALGLRSATSLLVAWVLSMGLSALVSAGAFNLLRPHRSSAPWWQFAVVKRYASLALRHHVLNLAITAVSFFLPVLAALLLLPRDYAYFSVAFLVASSIMLVPALLAMTLFAEATGDEALLRMHIRRTLPIGFACCALLLCIFEPGAPLVLGVFGKAYAVHGSPTLRVILLAGVSYVVKDHWVAIRRSQRRLTEAARVVACATVLEAVCAAVGGVEFGLRGLCGFWVAATAVEMVAFAPGVIQVWRAPTGHPQTAVGPRPPVSSASGAPLIGLGPRFELGNGQRREQVATAGSRARADLTSATKRDDEWWW